MKDLWDLAVVGGGASGLSAAVIASDLGDHVLVLEKNTAVGRKISASGNGRCNLMNTSRLKYYGEKAFAEDVINAFPPERIACFWEDLGLCLSEENDGRIYPFTYHSSSVIEALKKRLRSNQVKVCIQEYVKTAYHDGHYFRIETCNREYQASRLLIAAGGPASPKLGGTDSGYSLLQSFGHKLVSPFPALCSLITDKRSISGLSGIRVRCIVSMYNSSHTLLHREKGEVLFTEYGISGICIFQCARFASGGCTMELNLIHTLFAEKEDLIRYLNNRIKKLPGFQSDHLLHGIVVPKLSYAVMKQAGIDLKNKRTEDLTVRDIQSIADTLYAYTVQVSGVSGMDNAQVTAGGIRCSEFNPKTMESVIVPGLHASGEVLNVDGDCGGYNLMFAFASGILAGMNGRKGKDWMYAER